MSCDAKFDQSLSGVKWSPGFEKLELRNHFDQSMEGTTFPETFRMLTFGKDLSWSLQGVALPDGLTRLAFQGNYPASYLRDLNWPPSMRDVCVGGFYRFRCQDDCDR